MIPEMNGVHAEIRGHLERVLSTRGFNRAPQLGLFLRFIVEETLAGRGAQLKEYTIATDVYRRNPNFDPRLDATIRVEALKLRSRLEEYYCTAGAQATAYASCPGRVHIRRISLSPKMRT
jgi:hypothetical protein